MMSFEEDQIKKCTEVIKETEKKYSQSGASYDTPTSPNPSLKSPNPSLNGAFRGWGSSVRNVFSSDGKADEVSTRSAPSFRQTCFCPTGFCPKFFV